MKRAVGLLLLNLGAAACLLGGLGLALGVFVPLLEGLAWSVLRPAVSGGRFAVGSTLRLLHAIGYSVPFVVGGTLMACGALLMRAAGREHPPASLSEAS